MKKTFCLILIFVLCLTTFAGCTPALSPFLAFKRDYDKKKHNDLTIAIKYSENIEEILEDAIAIYNDETKPFVDQIDALLFLCTYEYTEEYTSKKSDSGSFHLFFSELTYENYGKYASEYLNMYVKDESKFKEGLKASFVSRDTISILVSAATAHMTTEENKLFLEKLGESPITTSNNAPSYLKTGVFEVLKINAPFLYKHSEIIFDGHLLKENQPNTIRDILLKNPEKFQTMNDRLAYLQFFYNKIMPFMETEYGEKSTEVWINTSAKEKELAIYIEPKLFFPFELEEVNAPDWMYSEDIDMDTISDTLPEGTIMPLIYTLSPREVTEKNPLHDTWLLYGDLQMGLPPERIPSSWEDTDYVFVLYSISMYNGIYTSKKLEDTLTGYETITNLFLFDAKTNEFVSYYGEIKTTPPMATLVDKNTEAVYADMPSINSIYRQLPLDEAT